MARELAGGPFFLRRVFILTTVGAEMGAAATASGFESDAGAAAAEEPLTKPLTRTCG